MIPIAPRREFQTANNNRPISTNIHSLVSQNSQQQQQFNNENVFNGRNIFTTSRAPPVRNWQTTAEEQTYGLDEEFLNPRKQMLHRHHQIA
uniref:Uncharacterized protein n=1 Tax=Panagrolaimus superbus TaxID=310955 RepID=A0A914YFY3_9BILA